ncbi:MAG: efflux RND transporter permease subunit, partial [bacterium]
MLNAIIRAALQNRLLTVALAALLFVYGTLVVRSLPVDVFPDLNRPTVTIQVEAGGLAPEEVETLVVQPIETAVNGATGVERVRSTAGIGLAQVFVEFGWGTDIYIDRQIVTEKLNAVRERLPVGVEPQLAPISSIMGQIMLVGLASPDGSVGELQLRELADWTLRPRLQSISGVAQVINIGGGVRQYQVQLLPERLANFQVSLSEVREALVKANATTGGGFLDQGDKELLIRGLGRVTGLSDLRDAVITERAGVPITVGDVATVTFGARVKRGDAGINGQPGVIVSIQKQPGASTVDLTTKVSAALEELRPSLPKGVELNTEVFRQANFIETAI